jgi:hypothetical protein
MNNHTPSKLTVPNTKSNRSQCQGPASINQTSLPSTTRRLGHTKKPIFHEIKGVCALFFLKHAAQFPC